MSILYIKRPVYVGGFEYEATILGFSMMNLKVAIIVVR